MARFPPAEAGNAPGRFQGNQGKAALAASLGEHRWCTNVQASKKKCRVKERPKGREEKEQKSAARQTMEGRWGKPMD